MRNFLQPATLLKTLIFYIFFKVFWQLYFKNINFLTNTRKCLLCWLLWIQNYQINPKKYPVHIYIYIYINEHLGFIIHMFYWCIQLDHEIYTKCKKKSFNLIQFISSCNIWSGTKIQQAKQKNHFSLTVPKTFWLFL